MASPDFGPGQHAAVSGMDLLLAGLLATFLLQFPLMLKQIHPTARGRRQVIYRGALAARMAFIVLLLRIMFALAGQ
jgi:hypothetical protein